MRALLLLACLACAPRVTVLPGDGVTYGWIKPRPLCSLNQSFATIQVPDSFREDRVDVRFVVRTDGRVDLIELPAGVPPEIAEPVRNAIVSCGWVPGRNPAGVPTSIRVLLPLAFVRAGQSSRPALVPDGVEGSGG